MGDSCFCSFDVLMWRLSSADQLCWFQYVCVEHCICRSLNENPQQPKEEEEEEEEERKKERKKERKNRRRSPMNHNVGKK